MARQKMATPYYTPPTSYPGAGIVPQPAQPAQSAVKAAPKGLKAAGGKLWEQARTTLKGQFIVLASAILILAVVEALLISQAFSRASADLDTIKSGSIPSVNAAQQMAQYIDDIDAKAADYLTAALTTAQPCSIVGTDRNPGALTVHDCDDQNINAEIILANKALFDAAHNVTYPGERTAIERITAGFEEYTGHIAIMRHEYEQAANKADPRDVHLQKARQAYQDANDVLQQHIKLQLLINPDDSPIYPESLATLPNCVIGNQSVPPATWVNGSINDNIDCLSYINKTHLDAAYNDTTSFLSFTILLTGALCLIFCIALVFTTWRMAAITHRVINIGLSLAALISIILSFSVVGLFSDMSGRHGSFGQMVKDDYDSIYYAALLKRYGTNANADESRWLIAMEFGDQASASRWQTDWQNNTQQVHTLIENAKANRTWPEEDQPLADVESNWDQYFQIDGQIREKANDLKNPNHIIDAETLSTGQSNLTFGNFSGAVDGLAQANQGHYDSTYASTQGALALYVILSAVLFPLLGLAAVWGVSRRLKDF